MKKIGDITNTADKNGEFTDGNVAAGTPPTQLMGAWFNSVQREILNVLAKVGMPQSATKEDQLAEAITKMVADAGYLPEGYSYSKTESNLKFQPVGNYASGINFYKTSAYIGMRPDKKNWAALLYDDGRFAVWDEENQNVTWGFNANGEMSAGLVPVTHGGTGAKTVLDARNNLSIYSKIEIDALLFNKQPKGNYANSNIFYETDTLIGMRTQSRNYGLIVNENGSVGCWNEIIKKYTFRFDSVGTLIDGTIPSSKVIGLAEIGVGQTWQDVKNSRAANTSYTNDTGKPILVNIGGTYLTGSNSSLLLVVSGITVGGMGGSIAATVPIFTSAIVPAGATYRVNITGTTASIGTWAELR